MRRVSAALAAVMAVTGIATAGTAGAPPAISFPRDHFAHPQTGIEWWYFTALVSDSARRPYSVFFTLFSSRGGLVAVSQVMDLRSGKVIGHTENIALGSPKPSNLNVKLPVASLRYLPEQKSWRFSVETPTFAVALSQRPLKPYALHGGGVIQQGPAGASHYYSSTRMTALGSLRTRTGTVRLRGQSWFDHQWGDYRDDPRAFNWDWFSCRFDDDTELMLYQFLDPRTGKPLAAYRNGTFVAKGGRATPVRSFEASAGSSVLVAAHHRWPRDWTLHVGSPSLEEKLTSVLPDQLVRNRILPTFWEGVATATGSKRGRCLVEISYR